MDNKNPEEMAQAALEKKDLAELAKVALESGVANHKQVKKREKMEKRREKHKKKHEAAKIAKKKKMAAGWAAKHGEGEDDEEEGMGGMTFVVGMTRAKAESREMERQIEGATEKIVGLGLGSKK